MPKLSARECVSFGWGMFMTRTWFFIGSSAVLFFVGMIANLPQALTSQSGSEITLIGGIGLIVSGLLSVLVSMGRTAFYLHAHDAAETVELSNLWHPHPYWKFLGASILVGIATVVGLILLIVPGIIVGIMLCFTLYIVIEKNVGPIAAMKESARLTKGNRWALLRLGFLVLVINIIGFCLVLVGLLVSLPISALAVVHAYRTLKASVPVEAVAVEV